MGERGRICPAGKSMSLAGGMAILREYEDVCNCIRFIILMRVKGSGIISATTDPETVDGRDLAPHGVHNLNS